MAWNSSRGFDSEMPIVPRALGLLWKFREAGSPRGRTAVIGIARKAGGSVSNHGAPRLPLSWARRLCTKSWLLLKFKSPGSGLCFPRLSKLLRATFKTYFQGSKNRVL